MDFIQTINHSSIKIFGEVIRNKFLKPIKHYLILALVFGISTLNGFLVKGQQLPFQKELADQYYSRFNYAGAAQAYEKLVAKKNPRPQYIRRLVDCYDHLRNYPKFLEWAGKAMDLKDAGPNDHFYLAKALQSTGRYDSAKVEFLRSKGTSLADNSFINNAIESCDWAKESSAQKIRYKVENTNFLNTPYSEFSPVKYGDSVLFVSDRPSTDLEIKAAKYPLSSKRYYGWTGNVYLKMFQASYNQVLDNGTIKDSVHQAVKFGPSILEGFHNGPVIFNQSGSRMYFTRTLNPKNKLKTGVNNQDSLRYFRTVIAENKRNYDLNIAYINRLELWYSDKVNGVWQEPKSFPFNQSYQYSLAHPTLSPDGKIIYFSSDMPGGKGGYDLYYSEILSDTSFSKPVNISSLNTSGDEEFPVIGLDSTLYFASNGRPGYGGLDIFSAKGEKDQWTRIHNLGKSINSDKDDFGLLTTNNEGSHGLFSSNREGGNGSDDIYSFDKIISYLNLVVRDNKTQIKIPFVNLSLTEPNLGTQNFITGTNGEVQVKLEPGYTYKILAQKGGFKDTTGFVIPNSERLKNDTLMIFMDSVSSITGNVVANKNRTHVIYYNFDKNNIRPDAKKELDSLLSDLKKEKDFQILVSSFADTRGSDAYNYALSQRRSKAVLTYLINHGIPKTSVQLAWFGDRQPINNCKKGVKCSESDFQLNRRSDIKVIPKQP